MIAIRFDAAYAEAVLKSRYSAICTPSVYIASFRNKEGKEVALERSRTNDVLIWAEAFDHALSGVRLRNKKSPGLPYGVGQSRNSNLNATRAPRLAVGNVAYYLEFDNQNALLKFLDWYDAAPSSKPHSKPLEKAPLKREHSASKEAVIVPQPLPAATTGLEIDEIIDTGLVIAEPYVSQIVDGYKDWEMRSKTAKRRGWIALIAKGTGTIVGVAKMVDCFGPLDDQEMLAAQDHHLLKESQIHDPTMRTWRMVWALESAVRLPNPVPYRHNAGAVTWVKLDEDAIAQLQSIACGAGAMLKHQKSQLSSGRNNSGVTKKTKFSQATIPMAGSGFTFQNVALVVNSFGTLCSLIVVLMLLGYAGYSSLNDDWGGVALGIVGLMMTSKVMAWTADAPWLVPAVMMFAYFSGDFPELF